MANPRSRVAKRRIWYFSWRKIGSATDAVDREESPRADRLPVVKPDAGSISRRRSGVPGRIAARSWTRSAYWSPAGGIRQKMTDRSDACPGFRGDQIGHGAMRHWRCCCPGLCRGSTTVPGQSHCYQSHCRQIDRYPGCCWNDDCRSHCCDHHHHAHCFGCCHFPASPCRRHVGGR